MSRPSYGCGWWLLWTSFYNDYIAYSKPSLAKCTDSTIVTLFRLLGWIFAAEEGDKCMPLSDVCDALGVSLDLSSSSIGFAFIRNTSSRVQELCADLNELIAPGHLMQNQPGGGGVACNLRKRRYLAALDDVA